MDEIERMLNELIPEEEVEAQPLIYMTKKLARLLISRAEAVLRAIPDAYYPREDSSMQYGHASLIRTFCKLVINGVYSAYSVSQDLRGRIEPGPLPEEDSLLVRTPISILRRIALQTIEEEEEDASGT